MRLAMGGSIPHVEPATSARATQGGDGHRVAKTDTSIRPPASGYDWDRLERAVRALVAQQERLQREVRTLRDDLGERNQRIRSLEQQLLEANQRRQDTSKRIDELIAQLDQLDGQLASAEPNA
jgi:septal ring factor EnvC (AmiA/AmiB activator)